MQGYWHIPAISASAGVISAMTQSLILFIIALLWLLLLYILKRLNFFTFLISLVALSFFLYYIPTDHKPRDDEVRQVEIGFRGKIVSAIERSEKRLQFLIKEDQSGDKYSIIYFLKNDSVEDLEPFSRLKYGAQCKVQGKTNPAQGSRNPGQFDFASYLWEQGIKTQVIISSPEHIYCSGASVFSPLFKFRENLLSQVDRLKNEHSKSWMFALVLGERSYLEAEIIDLFQRWGLSHILAISGLHVGIIVASLYFLLIRTNLLTKETTEWLLIGFLPLYAFLAGSAPSVLRASFMLMLVFLLRRFRIKIPLQDVISIIFLIFILFNPYMAYHVGFQFSFLVTFALILSRHWLSQVQSPFWQLLIISYVSQMVILPLQFHYFHSFQPLSIIVNYFIVPYFSVFVIPLMFFLLLLSFLSQGLTDMILSLFEAIQALVESLLLMIDQYLYIPIILGDFPFLWTVFYYLAFILSIKYIENKNLSSAFNYSLVTIAVILALIIRPYLSEEGRITMLDIGQGDAFVIELPYRKGVFFIDAGARPTADYKGASDEVYEQIIKAYLYSRGIWQVDAVMLSHDHLDHYGSSQFILEDFHSPYLIVSDYFEFNEAYKKLIDERDIHVERVGGREKFTLRGQVFEVLSPLKDARDIDDNSLVLKSRFGGKDWLFTGDIREGVERDLLSTYGDLKLDVLKVSHHGSKTATSSSFIEKTQPDYALISVGQYNSYGHPHQEVIERLEDNHVKVLRTDEYGAVQYIFKEDQGTFFSFLP